MDLSSLQVNIDPDDLSGLDPSVVALLEPCQPAEMRLRIALMKMQQSRIRGNSDYAAKIMEHAIEEGAKDRQAWTLLDKQIKKLEVEVNANKQAEEDEKKEKEKEKDKDKDEDDKDEEDKEKDDKTKEGEEGEDDEENKVTSEELEKLKKELEDEKSKSKTMQDFLMECLQEELGSVRAEQISLQEREARLKARIRSLQERIPKVLETSTNSDKDEELKRKELEDTLKEIQENQCTILNTECVVCKEQPATKAVIPCGHLCLCDGCTKSISKLDSASKTCPLCRGQFLSTLHIYTSNL